MLRDILLSKQYTNKPQSNLFHLPFTQGTSGDPLFDMGGLDHALPTNGTEGKKDAKSFLGTHADLVNLDNLVTKPPGLILHAQPQLNQICWGFF